MEFGGSLHEGLRVARAAERLAALGYPLRTTLALCDNVLELAPELKPEVDEIRRRVEETVGHVTAASLVLLAKLELA